MTKYTASQRAPRQRRSLSRRAQLFIIAGLLVTVSLLTITNIPASAAAKFTTLQDVQDAINAALAPISGAISSLQQTQTNQATQLSSQQSAITNLQNNTSNKALRVYDANGQELGIVVDHNGPFSTIFSPTMQKFIYIQIDTDTGTNASIYGQFRGTQAFYQSSDCTGTPYIDALSVTNESLSNDLIVFTPQAFYTILNSDTPITISPKSVAAWSYGANSLKCFANTGPDIQAYPLTHQVSLPFTIPLALPLQFKYQ